jgi:hypothetical protein
MKKQITVWPDDTEGNRMWIVSRDTVEEIGGGAINTHTLDACEDVEDARELADKEGAAQGLPVVEQDGQGIATVRSEARINE